MPDFLNVLLAFTNDNGADLSFFEQFFKDWVGKIVWGAHDNWIVGFVDVSLITFYDWACNVSTP